VLLVRASARTAKMDGCRLGAIATNLGFVPGSGVAVLLCDTDDAMTLVSEKGPYISSYVLFSLMCVSLCHQCHRLWARRVSQLVPRPFARNCRPVLADLSSTEIQHGCGM
jgi:hypothetical protein